MTAPAGRLPAVVPHPAPLARHYTRFRVAERLLLTGHSHQAWPDCSFEAQQQAWLDAAELVDAKWDRAEERAEAVRAGYHRWLGDNARAGTITLGPNTHELLVRLLSALPLRQRPRVVTTDGEFHSARRQLDRLAEEGLEVVKVAAQPVGDLPDRLADAVDDRTAAVVVSKVLFGTGRIVPDLAPLAAAARRHGAALVVDAYHALGAVPFQLAAEDLTDAFVVGGGYKYLQHGEGSCFLRWPAGTPLRPAYTGWFAEFGELAERRAPGEVPYGDGPERFAGSTYDPTSHHRAARVFAFFDEQGLTPHELRRTSQHQVGRLALAFDALDLDPGLVDRDRAVPLSDIGGFLALRAPRAGELRAALLERGVLTDHRQDVLRMGPAPYLSDHQLDDAVAALGDAARGLGGLTH